LSHQAFLLRMCVAQRVISDGLLPFHNTGVVSVLGLG
jgi:hypothetical protein